MLNLPHPRAREHNGFPGLEQVERLHGIGKPSDDAAREFRTGIPLCLEIPPQTRVLLQRRGSPQRWPKTHRKVE